MKNFTYTPDYSSGKRSTLISKKIKLLRNEGKSKDQSIAIALKMYPKSKKLPLA